MRVTEEGRDAMNARKLLTIAMVAMMLIGGAAAVGAASPADAPTDNHGDGADADDSSDRGNGNADNASDRGDVDNASDRGDAANASRGPPSDMPDTAPDHVREIHETINSYLDGDVDHLGSSLSDYLVSLMGNGNAADELDDDEETEDDEELPEEEDDGTEDENNDDEDDGDETDDA